MSKTVATNVPKLIARCGTVRPQITWSHPLQVPVLGVVKVVENHYLEHFPIKKDWSQLVW